MNKWIIILLVYIILYYIIFINLFRTFFLNIVSGHLINEFILKCNSYKKNLINARTINGKGFEIHISTKLMNSISSLKTHTWYLTGYKLLFWVDKFLKMILTILITNKRICELHKKWVYIKERERHFVQFKKQFSKFKYFYTWWYPMICVSSTICCSCFV